MNHLEGYKSKKFDNGKTIEYSQKCNSYSQHIKMESIHAINNETEKFERIHTRIFNFSKIFFLWVLSKIEYEDIVEIEAKHEVQEELEIDLEDSEDEFIIDEEESESEPESDYGIADSCFESDSDSDIVNHAEVISHSITRAEINTLDGTNRMCVIYFYYLYTSNHFSDRDKFCSSCIVHA